MTFKILLLLFLFSFMLSGCGIAMLLFYRESSTVTLYKSTGSKKDHYEIKANTLSHCGCTDLYVTNYNGGKKAFELFYSSRQVKKTIYRDGDTVRLLATPELNYTVPFDSMDLRLFHIIDSLITVKPKGLVYRPQKKTYQGYIADPYYAN